MAFELPPIELVLDEHPPARDLQSVLNGLLSFNRPLEPDGRYTKLAVLVTDGLNAVRGGLTGALYFNALFIEHLWVEDGLRGQAVGRALVESAEREALSCGREIVHLECMSFQASGFFAALGYREYARLEGYPDGAARVHYCRDLRTQTAPLSARDELLSRLGLQVAVKSDPNEQAVRAVRDGMTAYNAQFYQPEATRPLNVLVRGPDGQVLGGLTGVTHWNACFVDLLWLDYGLRRLGFGSQVMRLAEREAQARGCEFIHLDTFNFQARGFYEKIGFHVYGAVTGFTDGVVRYHLVKPLVPSGSIQGGADHVDGRVRA